MLVAALALAGCGDSKEAATTTAASGGAAHAAPELEALLPDELDGTPLRKGSTTGAVVFGGNAFGERVTRFLAKHGKKPGDLRFANAQASPRAAEVELGVFEVKGLDGSLLRRAIVDASRPNAPGLKAVAASLAGKPVTSLVYPGGTTVYLYPHGDAVYYVGTQDTTLAERALETFP